VAGSIQVKGLTKSFGTFRAVNDVTFEAAEGTITALLGPSGSGKSTVLRMIAGLEQPDSGSVWVAGEELTEASVQDRRLGFVFQHYALFRHMTVRKNVAFGLSVRRADKATQRKRVEELLELVGLAPFGDRYPDQLSGGQRQRVALARALAPRPKVLLLDEPFGALDARVRQELRAWLDHLHRELGVTSLFVTHDQEEALDLADRVAIMNKGRIEQIGSPAEIYEGPETPFVFDFLGRTNAFACEVKNGKAKLGDKSFPVEDVPDGNAVAFVRPHDIVLAATASEGPSDDALLPGAAIVRFVSSLGPRASVELLHEKHLIEAVISRETMQELGLEVGSKCRIRLRLPTIFAKTEVDEEARGDKTKKHWLRLRPKRKRRTP
jgi:sulfate transport system ATP-binding protein